MIRVRHRYALLFLREDGTLITQCAVEPDWEPVFEAGRFEAARRGRLAPADLVDGAIVPRWDSHNGAPYVSALDVELDVQGAPWSCEIPVTCFRETARAHASVLVDGGLLAEGETYRYLPLAFAHPETEGDPPSGSTVEELPQELSVCDVALAPRLSASRPVVVES